VLKKHLFFCRIIVRHPTVGLLTERIRAKH
jgi:hypothetical protein